jgi:hypothetical protein
LPKTAFTGDIEVMLADLDNSLDCHRTRSRSPSRAPGRV